MTMSVEVDGVVELVNRITKFDKGVSSILTKEINAATRSVSNEAKANTPNVGLSGWGQWFETKGTNAQRGVVQLQSSSRSIAYVGSEVKSKIRPQLSKTSRRGRLIAVKARVVTMSPAGAIFALAGSVDDSSDFKRNLIKKHGSAWPRVLSAALYDKGPEARKGIEKAIDKAARAVAG
jgi:hypothetical protein